MAVEKVKVMDIANEIGVRPKDVVAKAAEIGISIKSVNSSVDSKSAEVIYKYIATGEKPEIIEEPKPKKAASKKTADKKSAESSTKAKKTDSKEASKPKSAKKPAKTESSTKDSKKDSAILVQDSKQDSKKEAKDSKPTKAPESQKILDTPKQINTRQIIVVSKNQAKDEEPKPKPTPSKNSAVEDILSIRDMQDSLNSKDYTTPKKKKKDVKKAHTAKHLNEHKIDMERDLGDSMLDDEDKDEVMLLDLSEVEPKSDEREFERKDRIEDRVRIQRANPWFFDSIKRDGKKRKKWSNHSTQNAAASEKVSNIVIPDEIRVYEFADKIGVKVTDIISKLFKMGEMVTKNDFLDSTTLEILAQEFDVVVEIKEATQELDYLQENDSSDNEELVSRPPVVTIMGHVDHGKTSLLDYIRNSNISKAEHGGITQHIGAYMVEKNGRNITFIDTPGHEAFANMRSRGAQVTDIAIIVIAADDGVKQQTKEALAHAKDSNVQIIIAMNKMDKENANPDKLKAEMAEIGYNPSDWGGEYDFIPISAKTGDGVDNLLDTILLQADIMELKANIKGQPKAVILEGSLDKGKGPVVTAVVQSGILKVGDSVVADTAYGKVRTLIRDNGEKVESIKPSEVAVLSGLSEVPSAGAILSVVADDSIAKDYALKRKSYLRSKELSKSTKVSFDELSSVVAEGKLKPLLIILKADTQGSLEAVKASLETLSNNEIRVNIISSSVGSINENDINTAHSAKDCYILGFNVKPLGILKAKAKELNVSIRSYSVIYNLIDDVKDIIANMMSPIVEEELIGSVEVRDVFSVGKGGVIAGCFVLDGSVSRDSKVRLMRGNKELYFGAIASLKRFKDDVKEVSKGYECGIMLESFNDIKVGDNFDVIKEVYKKKKYE